MSFMAIPAIDILGGKCVRLERGDFDKATTYSEDPSQVAASLAGAGASRIHVVDLDGAKQGRRANRNAIAKVIQAAVAASPSVSVQVGGGLRTVGDIEGTLDCGASHVVVGTAAVSDMGFLRSACDAAPGSVYVGIDARGGMVSVSGWTEDSGVDAGELAAKVADQGVAGIILTDIDRDGVMSGPNAEATAALADTSPCPVFASGGVRSMDDLVALSETKVAGAIVGKALYSGAVTAQDLAGFNGARQA